MNVRQEKIIQLLKNRRTWMKGREIAGCMDVTTRTIRSDMEVIAAAKGKNFIESSTQKGYRLRDLDCILENAQPAIPQTPAQRRKFILKRLLCQREVNENMLPELVYASSYTIDGDLKAIRHFLKDFGGLRLVNHRHFLSLDGQETQKRKLYRTLLYEEIGQNFLNLDQIARLYTEFDLLKTYQILESCLDQHNFRLRDTSLGMLLMHLGISLERILHYNYVELPPCQEDLGGSVEYEIASEFFAQIGRLHQIQVPEMEIQSLALLLLGRRRSEHLIQEVNYNGRPIEIQPLCQKIIQAITCHYGVDFSEDEQLRAGLSLHLGQLVCRLEHQVVLENLYLNEIRYKFPLIYEMGIEAASVIQQELDAAIDPGEIGFICLHFGSTYNRLEPDKKYRVVAIFPKDRSLDQHPLHYLEQRFQDRIEVIMTLNAFEGRKVEFCQPDLLISVLPVEHNLLLPAIQIDLFDDHGNEARLLECLNSLDSRKLRRQMKERILPLFDPRFFFGHLQADTPHQVIETICAPLAEYGYVDSDYVQAVLDREKLAPTSFQGGFAMPHSFHNRPLRNALAVAVLKKPVQWGNYTVSFVILLAIRDVDRRLVEMFFRWWVQLVSNPAALNQLQQRDFDSFMEAVRLAGSEQ